MNRKHFLIFLIPALMLSYFAAAEPVSKDETREAALKFFGMTKAASSVKEVDGGADRSFTVYNREGGGWVIISNEDAISPVLAYSHTGSFNFDEMSDGLGWWAGATKSYIDEASRLSLPRHQGWNMGSTKGSTGEYVLETALWHQKSPFNISYPIAYDGEGVPGHNYVGCVAAAAGIICRYHKWPKAGTGVIPEYTYKDDAGVIHTNPERTPGAYDLSNMPLVVDENTPEEQTRAISDFLYDISSSLRTIFHYPSGSAASSSMVNVMMARHFGYDKNMRIAQSNWYSEEDWNELMRHEIRTVGPVQYSGQDDSHGGHSFVLDGFADGDYFHINWGWGGENNGFFLLPALNVNHNGVDYAYNSSQEAVLGFKPDREGNSECLFPIVFDYDEDYSGLEIVEGVPESGQNFSVKAGYFTNLSSVLFTGRAAIALFDKDDKLKEVVSEYFDFKDYENLFEAYFKDNNPDNSLVWDAIPCRITGKVRPGDRLRMYLETDTFTSWVARLDENATDMIPVMGVSPEEVSAATSLSYDKASGTMTFTCAPAADYRLVDSTGNVISEYQAEAGSPFTLDTKSLGSAIYTLYIYGGVEPYVLNIKL